MFESETRRTRAAAAPAAHRHRRHGFGPGPFGGFGGFGGWGRGPRGRGRKARRGDIRTAALLLLAEEPRNGYQIMQEVQERSDGVWRPSPGSVYPALQQLEDEGLIRSEEPDGRKLFALTDEGRAHVQERDADKPAPWEQMSGDVSDEAHELGKLMREVAFAFVQVMRTGSERQIGKAREVLADSAARPLPDPRRRRAARRRGRGRPERGRRPAPAPGAGVAARAATALVERLRRDAEQRVLVLRSLDSARRAWPRELRGVAERLAFGQRLQDAAQGEHRPDPARRPHARRAPFDAALDRVDRLRQRRRVAHEARQRARSSPASRARRSSRARGRCR